MRDFKSLGDILRKLLEGYKSSLESGACICCAGVVDKRVSIVYC